MVKEMTIYKLEKKISLSEQKKIIHFARAITSNKDSIKKIDSEFPKKGISGINFEIDTTLDKLAILNIFYFLCFLQGIEVNSPSGEWSSIRCGKYIITLYNNGQGNLIRY